MPMPPPDNCDPCDVFAALNRSQAIAELTTDGTVCTANERFLHLFGLTASEIVGVHHSALLTPEQTAADGREDTWNTLRRGDPQLIDCRLAGPDAREAWVKASFNPLLDEAGHLRKVVLHAIDITAVKLRSIDHQGKVVAIDRSQAVIEFALDGTILDANQHFCDALGYAADELRGRHHRILVHPEYRDTAEYAEFWAALRRGEFWQAEYRRVSKTGEDVWIQATYNPVIDPLGKILKVVKFATNVTAAKLRALDDAGKIDAIDRSQAVIEFALDGTILDANQHFCDALGYAADELRGRHHRILVHPEYRDTAEYAEFWAALRRGEFWQAEYRRVSKTGEDVWIQATYNPIIDPLGKILKVVKFATNVTAAKLRALDDAGKIDAINRSQAVMELSMTGKVLHANAHWLQLVGYDMEEIRGKHHDMFLVSDDHEGEAPISFWAALEQGNFQRADYQIVRKDGRIAWTRATYHPILSGLGKPIKVVMFATDVTDEINRREQTRLLALVADATSNAVIITNVDGLIEYVNMGFTRTTGYRFTEVRGRKPGTFLQGPRTDETTRNRLRAALKDHVPFFGELVNYTKAGEPYWASLFINPVSGEDGRINRFVSIQVDVTDRKQADERIAFMAQHDALTGLANRTLFRSRLQIATQQDVRVALLCLDLDRFKQVNDTLGHPAGDGLLQQVAERLLTCVRTSDTVARLGGDEFAIICAGADAEAIAGRAIEHLAAPYVLGQHQVSIGVSVGIAVAGRSASPDILIQQADEALYSAKRAGRGTARVFGSRETLAVHESPPHRLG